MLANTPINRDAADSSTSPQINSGLVNLFGKLPGGRQNEGPDPRIPMPLGGNGASQELASPLRLRYKILPNRIQMGNISSASVVVAGPGSSKRIYEVDPLRCPHCGSEMQIIAWIEQSEVIRKILRHLNLWERPQRSPPTKLFPHKLETFMASLSPRQAQEIRASTESVFWDDVPVWND